MNNEKTTEFINHICFLLNFIAFRPPNATAIVSPPCKMRNHMVSYKPNCHKLQLKIHQRKFYFENYKKMFAKKRQNE